MKKIHLFTIALLFTGNCAMQAQIEKSDNKKETEITVKDAQGKQVTIDLPEAMTQELDSLMHLYNKKIILNLIQTAICRMLILYMIRQFT